MYYKHIYTHRLLNKKQKHQRPQNKNSSSPPFPPQTHSGSHQILPNPRAAKTAWSKCVSTKDCPKCSAWNPGGTGRLGENFSPWTTSQKRFQWDRVSWLKQRLVRIGVIDVVKVSNLETLCFFFLLHEFCVKTYRRNLEISKQSKFGFHDFLKDMFGGKNVMWGTIEICVLSNNIHQQDDRPKTIHHVVMIQRRISTTSKHSAQGTKITVLHGTLSGWCPTWGVNAQDAATKINQKTNPYWGRSIQRTNWGFPT